MAGDEAGYPLDLLTPARHVATEIERAAAAALSLAEMAAGYQHPNPADIGRVREAEGKATDAEAIEWLMDQALLKIKRRGKRRMIEPTDDGRWRFADGVTFDDLRWGRDPLQRRRDDHAQFRDPFNPMSGRFSDNIRTATERKDSPELAELRASLQEFGWLPEFPAIKDERDVVLVGHRRLSVAAELGIEVRDGIEVRRVTLGDGDEADAKRFALAVASNLGSKPFSQPERKDLAEYLYGEREWTMARIAEALKVSEATVSRDLSSCTVQEPKPQSTSVHSRPGRPGRPKGRARKRATPELEEEVDDLVKRGEPVNRGKLGTKHGVGDKTVQLAHQRAIGRHEREQQTPPDPRITDEEETHACPTCGHQHTSR